MLVNKISQCGNGHKGFWTKIEDELVELSPTLDDWTLAHYVFDTDGALEPTKIALAASRCWVQKHPNALSCMKNWGEVADYRARKLLFQSEG